MKVFVALMALLASGVAWSADEFRDAKILDVDAKEETISGISVPYLVITVQLGSQKIGARTYQVGGGMGYVMKHPEATVVGTTVPGRVDQNVLELKIGPDKKVVKLKIQRIENLGSGTPAE